MAAVTALLGVTPPSRANPAQFDDNADALFGALPEFVDQLNAVEASLTYSNHFGTSLTSVAIGTGAKAFSASPGKSWQSGGWIYIASTVAPANYMIGQVTGYNATSGALTVTVTAASGSGSAASWIIGLTTPNGSLSGGVAGAIPYQSAPNVTAFSPPGTAGQVFVSGGTGAPPGWTSAPTFTTQAISDNSTTAATTAFARRVATFRSGITLLSAAATLTATAAGALIVCGGSAAYTVNLPAASAVPAGATVEFQSASSAVVTIARAGSDTINALTATGMTTATLNGAGDAALLVSDGVSTWYLVGNPGRRRYESTWTASLPAAGSATAFTHGLGVAPANAWVVAECTTAELGYSVGDRVIPGAGASAYVGPVTIAMTPTQAIVLGPPNAWSAVPRAGGVPSAMTATAWRYKLIAEA